MLLPNHGEGDDERHDNRQHEQLGPGNLRHLEPLRDPAGQCSLQEVDGIGCSIRPIVIERGNVGELRNIHLTQLALDSTRIERTIVRVLGQQLVNQLNESRGTLHSQIGQLRRMTIQMLFKNLSKSVSREWRPTADEFEQHAA